MSRKPEVTMKDASRLRAFSETDEEITQHVAHVSHIVLRVIDDETVEFVKSRYTKHGVYRLVEDDKQPRKRSVKRSR